MEQILPHSPQEELPPEIPWSWTSGLQNCETINLVVEAMNLWFFSSSSKRIYLGCIICLMDTSILPFLAGCFPLNRPVSSWVGWACPGKAWLPFACGMWICLTIVGSKVSVSVMLAHSSLSTIPSLSPPALPPPPLPFSYFPDSTATPQRLGGNPSPVMDYHLRGVAPPPTGQVGTGS